MVVGLTRRHLVQLGAVVLAVLQPLTTQEAAETAGAATKPGQTRQPTKETGDATDMTIVVRPIGVVHSPYKVAKGTPIQGTFGDQTEAWVELQKKYVAGLKDLEGFSHAILLYHFHKSDKEEIVGSPYLEKQAHGIFATRSPHRPNHLGLSVVKIQRIEGPRLYFTEVDILDGTPVLDIKPYVRQFDCRDNAVSGWIENHFQDGRRPEGKVAE